MRIVAMTCSYCGYSAADLAGTQGRRYHPDTTVVRLPCTGRLDVRLLLRAFREGADAVLVIGCLEGNCHFQYGNVEARKRVGQAKAVLAQVGIEPERLEMVNLASNQAWRFVEAVEGMRARLDRMGESPINKVRS